MDFPPLNPGYSPEILSHANRLVAAYATKPQAPAPAAPPPPQPDNGILTDIGHGLARGVMVGAPTKVGQMLKAPGAPGDTLYDAGQSMVDAATAREQGNDLYRTTGAWGAGADMLASGLPALAAAPAAAMLGAPALAVAGAGAVASGALFGGSSFQDTYERATKAGISPEAAHDAALKVGAIQGVGQGVATAVGARLLTGAAGAVAKSSGAQGVLDSFASPKFLKPFATGMAENVATQIPVQMGAAAGVAAVEKNAGIDAPDSWEAAKSTIAPTAAMTMLMGPLGAAGLVMNNRRKAQIAANVSTAPPADAPAEIKSSVANMRMRDAEQLAREMRRVDPDAANKWHMEALRAINADEAVDLHIGFDAEAARAARIAPGEFQLQPTDPNAQPPLELQQSGEQPMPLDQSGQGQLDLQDPRQGELALGRNNTAEETAQQLRESVGDNGPIAPTPPPTPPTLPKGGRGSGMSADEATARIVAAKEAEGAGQGTARALGLLNDSPIVKVSDAGTSYSLNKQERVQWMKSVLGTTPSDLISKMSTLEPNALAETLQQVWHDKGGEGGPKYLAKIELLYKQVTGKDIRELKGAPETGHRDHFDLRVPNAEELAQQQRDAAAIRGQSEKPLTAQEKAQITKRQGDLFKEQKPLTKAQEKAQRDVAKMLVREVTSEAANEAKAEPSKGEPAKAGAEDAARVEQVAQAQGDAQSQRGAGRATQEELAAGRLLSGDESALAPATTKQAQAKAQGKNVDYFPKSKVIRSAVVKFGGQTFDGANHLEALKKAKDAGAISIVDGKVKTQPGDDYNLFRLKNGEIVSRAHVEELTGAGRTEDINKQLDAPKMSKAQAKAAETERARTAADERAQAIADTIGRHDRETTQLQAEFRALSTIPKPNKQQFARKNFLETEINARAQERADLTQKHSDAVGVAEDVAHGNVEPVRSRSEWAFTDGKWDDQAGIGPSDISGQGGNSYGARRQANLNIGSATSNLLKVVDFISARIASRTATPAERKFLANAAKYVGGERSSKSARDALGTLSESEHAKYVERVQHYIAAVKLAQDMKGIANEAKGREYVDETVRMASHEQRIKAVDEALANGTMTLKEATAESEAIAKDAKNLQSEMDSFKRGINALTDTSLQAHVEQHGTATAAMDYIARNHKNPLVRAVAKLLNNSNLNTRVIVVDNPTFNGGRYNRLSNQIEIGRGGMNAVTLMHESTHALVHRALSDALIDQHRASITPKQRDGVEALHVVQDIMATFRKKADFENESHRLALEDEHEFVAEALNNPQIQKILGGTKFWNSVRKLVGLAPKDQTEFERLMDASTMLFGDSRVDSLKPFQDSVRSTFHRALNANSPSDAVEMTQRAHKALAGVPSKLANWLGGKDIKASWTQEGLSWVSLNHMQWLTKRTTDNIRAAFPANKELHTALSAFDQAFGGWQRMVSERRGQGQHLINGKDESQDVIRHMMQQLSSQPGAFNRMSQMARDAKATGMFPSDKTLAEAQARNPKITQAMFNHPAAVRAREQYEQLNRSHPEMVKTYESMLQKHRLDFARYYATVLENTLRLEKLHMAEGIKDRVGELDWTVHKDLPVTLQEEKLNGVMKHIQGKLNDLHVRLNLQDKEGQAAKDATLIKQNVDSLLGEYNRQRSTPYVHIGRVGDYHIGMEISTAPGAWERVGKLIGGDKEQGGLHRDWHEPILNRDGKGNRKVYMKFDSAQALNDAVAKLEPLRAEKLFHDAEGKDTYFDGAVIDHSRMFEAASPGFIRSLTKRINDSAEYDADTKKAMVRDIIDTHRQQLPETSPLKASMFADGHNGASTDLIRTFGDRMTMSNQALVNARAAPRIADALTDMRSAMKGLGSMPIGDEKLKLARYVQELTGRAEDMQTPVYSPTIARAKGLTAVWRLAMSPAYVAMTMYQPWQMTLPFVGAKFGFSQTMLSMGKNFGMSLGILNALMKHGWGQQKGDAFFNKLSNMSDLALRFRELKNSDGTPLLNGEMLGMLEHLQWSGLLNFGQAQQIFRTDPADISAAGKAIRIATVMPHYAEMSNRITGAMTAFEMYLKKNPDKLTDRAKLVKAAQEFAVATVNHTDGNHSQSNVARRLGSRGVAGKVTPLFVGFQQYDIQMMEFLSRMAMQAWGFDKNAREAQAMLLGVSATTAAMAGTLGLPMMGILTAVSNALGDMFGDETGTPPDFAHAWREYMNGVFGEKGGEIVSKGLPRALNFDMSARSGYQDLAPFSEFLQDRRLMKDRLKDGALNFMGPAVGVLAGIATGAQAAHQGDYVTAINEALPAGVRNIAKAYRLSQYGYETQGGNNEIPIPHDNWNVMMQGMGFTSGVKAEQSEQTFQFNTNQQLMQRQQQILRNHAYRAMERGDYENVGAIIQRNIDFAMQHPQFHADISSGLADRARQRAIGSMTGGVLTTPHTLPYLQQYFPQARQ